jgi:tetratricopeptide (TPR) repeat protein
MIRGLVVVLAVLAASPAHAQEGGVAGDAEARARELTDSGRRHYDVGEYDEAIADYREAYRLSPRPGLLFNLGQAFRLKGDCLTATRMYRNYLRLEPGSKHRELVEQHLAALAECAAEREAAGASAAASEGSETEPPPAEPEPEPPPVEEVAPPPSPAVRDEPVVVVRRERPGRTRRVTGLVIGATGLVAAAAGGYFALDARRAADEVSRGFEEGADWSELEGTDARGRRSEVIGVGLLATGAAAVVCGATLYALGWRADRQAVHAVVVPVDRGAGVEVSWRF